MRQVMNPQLTLDELDIGKIELNARSRDDIPQLLRGLQFIYTTPELRARVFQILAEVVPPATDGNGRADTRLGRPGMEQWRIFVLGSLRLSLNADYDRVAELANEHKNLRKMLGHTGWKDEKDSTEYLVQTLKDNLRLFTPEILSRINLEVVKAGHALIKKVGCDKSCDKLNARIDSFVVETDVHYPTDTNLLWDAIRKTVKLCARLYGRRLRTDWRQSEHIVRGFKRKLRHVQKLKHSTSKDEARRQEKALEIVAAHRDYIEVAGQLLLRARTTRAELESEARGNLGLTYKLIQLDDYVQHAERQIDQIRRRVLQGQTIPHEEKVFSIFEPHTEWISKGKAGVPFELGMAVVIVEDQNRFILGHQVMEKTSDKEVAVPLVKQIRADYGALSSVSFDKGFHTAENRSALNGLVDRVVMPRPGRLSIADREREAQPEFTRLRNAHSAVESAINALECHGLDRCLDEGVDGFKRYVALSVVARNVLRIGQILRSAELARLHRTRFKRAA